jgi:hypothetical protein
LHLRLNTNNPLELKLDTPNIFAVAASDIPAEDKFTAGLAYLISNIPEIGAEWAALLAKEGALKPPTFKNATDHPEGDAESKPDFLLACDQYDIRCEHKLDSKLGKRQLERYLALPDRNNRPTYVALIVNWDTPELVSSEVTGRSRYLQPRRSGQPYFTWQQLYPIVAKHGDRLAREFAVYMEGLGMAPITMPSNWDGLFSDKDVAASFQALTKPLKDYFKSFGAVSKGDAGKLGVQVQHPTQWLHLLYFYVSKTTKPFEPELKGPFIAARVFINKTQGECLARFQGRKDHLETRHGPVVGRPVKETAYSKGVELAYEYVAPLSNYLTNNELDTRQNLLQFAKTVFEHTSKVAK